MKLSEGLQANLRLALALVIITINIGSVQGIRLQLEKNITILKGSQYMIDIQFLRKSTEDSHEQIFYTTDVSVFRRYPIDSSIFDTFLLEGDQEINCYNKAISNYNQMQCPFLSNEAQSQIRVSNANVTLQNSVPFESVQDSNVTFIIDNTQFPIQGAYYQADLQLQILYGTELSFDDYYYNLFYKSVITCSIISFYIILWSIILICKVRKLRKKHRHIEIGLDQDDRSEIKDNNTLIQSKSMAQPRGNNFQYQNNQSQFRNNDQSIRIPLAQNQY